MPHEMLSVISTNVLFMEDRDKERKYKYNIQYKRLSL